ncbi:histidine phosphatase superfamily [Infundibulicybe gibba]|nr:histidine phosphatase superfamily [Infundibulicybe gibba]
MLTSQNCFIAVVLSCAGSALALPSGHASPFVGVSSTSQVGFPGPTPSMSIPSRHDHDLYSNNNSRSMAIYRLVVFGLPGASPLVPEGCEITQVHLLHRHGARYPTSDASPALLAAKLHTAAAGQGLNVSGPLSFLSNWTYKLGAEILTPFGRSQMFDLGVGFRVKYGELMKDFDDLPVFRTTSEGNSSSLSFAAGFFGIQKMASSYHQLIMIEADNFNNTLAPYDNCPNSNTASIAGVGNVQSTKWAQIYLKQAAQRISSFVQGVEFTPTDLVAMQQLCAYETVALGFSSFCELFTQQEWQGYAYHDDLLFWYSNGPGNPTSAPLGIGYIQELVSRLTQTPITEFNTSVNKTIVSNNATFPLNQPIYVDASHDTILTAIYTAFNFTSLAATGPLPTDHIPVGRTYHSNQLAPFGSNLVGQVLSCPASSKPTHIRWILNDGVLPLTGIKGCQANKDGLCDLDTFIAAMKQRIQEVDFNFGCFANYTVPVPDNLVTGQLF